MNYFNSSSRFFKGKLDRSRPVKFEWDHGTLFFLRRSYASSDACVFHVTDIFKTMEGQKGLLFPPNVGDWVIFFYDLRAVCSSCTLYVARHKMIADQCMQQNTQPGVRGEGRAVRDVADD